ncbi:hypothetical protein D9758_004355 [Tetrapyrgos nigripes]|uniref:FAD/NAD(P)-binding domain-containing protein n=1 Tax=Tetrapyrgos nigripes TaxID=182062 RepID=A0A8H5LSP1_9AGAR|nr:hypothetical protein D9758_004355 [Tetrapyrgos nigripes]
MNADGQHSPLRIIMKTIAILGGAYAGAPAAARLAAGLPKRWRIVVIDKNTHINHVYVMPRYAVLGGHEHKAFCPRINFFQLLPNPSSLHSSEKQPAYDKENHPHLILNAEVLALTPTHVTLNKSFPEHGFPTTEIRYDYLLYALGSKLPAPLDLWGALPGSIPVSAEPEESKGLPERYNGTKTEGITWLKTHQKVIEDAQRILVVGGGALGIQFATDIAHIHPRKSVILLHSREKLLPRFDSEMHSEIRLALESLGVDVILNERLADRDAPPKYNEKGQRVLKTIKGREIVADLVLMCTGQTPNTSILKAMDPATVNPHSGLAYVLKTMQLAVQPQYSSITSGEEIALQNLSLDSKDHSIDSTLRVATPYPHIFVAGDTADAFGAIAAGHTAHFQAEVAADNILNLIEVRERHEQLVEKGGNLAYCKGDEELREYVPTPPAIKVSLGLNDSITQSNGIIGKKSDGVDDLNAAAVWAYWGMKVQSDSEMYL